MTIGFWDIVHDSPSSLCMYGDSIYWCMNLAIVVLINIFLMYFQLNALRQDAVECGPKCIKLKKNDYVLFKISVICSGLNIYIWLWYSIAYFLQRVIHVRVKISENYTQILSQCRVGANHITMTSQWAWWCLRSPASRLFTQSLFGHRSKKTSKLRVTGLCVGNSPGTGEFPAQKASYAENVSIWWRHHVKSWVTK